MITVIYRLIGNVNNSQLEKSFSTEEAYSAWFSQQTNIVIISVDRTGVSMFSYLYGVK